MKFRGASASRTVRTTVFARSYTEYKRTIGPVEKFFSLSPTPENARASRSAAALTLTVDFATDQRVPHIAWMRTTS